MSAGLSTPLPLLFSFGSTAVPAAASVYSPFAFWVGGAGSSLAILPGASFESTVCILSSTSETVDVMTSTESTVCVGSSFDSTVCIADLSGFDLGSYYESSSGQPYLSSASTAYRPAGG